MRNRSRTTVVAAIGLGVAAVCAVATTAAATKVGIAGNPAVVRTDSGPVRGTVSASSRSFQGIPYAAPPVGDLRWASPRSPAAWTVTRDATAPGADCPQTAGFLGDKPSVDENCLFLNVTTPRNVSGRRLPVMFWVHGGGFYSGSGRLYDAQRMADKGDVVVVTFNYRLGVFGFLDHPALDGAGHMSGDFGLEDQQAALRWVRRNAAAFGGDAGNVTLFGESAGGVSACAHLASPRSRGLFRRAIIQSGPCALTTQWPWKDGGWVARSRTVAAAQGVALAKRLGCATPATVACLRRKPVSALLDASEGGQGYGPAYGTGVLPVSPYQALATGRFARVPVIQGSTRDEQRTFTAAVEEFSGHVLTDADYAQQVKDYFGADKGAKVLARYPRGDYDSASTALSAVWSDYTWGCTALATDRLLSRANPTWAYEFGDRDAPWAKDGVTPSFPTGAFHAAELQYLFSDEQFPGPRTAAQRDLSDEMIGYWTRFAHTGDPNGAGAPAWNRFDGRTVHGLIPGKTRNVDLAAEHRCGFWSSL